MKIAQTIFYSFVTIGMLSISVQTEAATLKNFSNQRRSERQNIVVPQKNTVPKKTIIYSAEEEKILSKINEFRVQKNATPLQSNGTLRNIAEKQILNPSEEYTDENLRKSMENMPIFPAKKSTIEDCNCYGTNDIYRQVKIPFTTIENTVSVLQQQPGIVSNDVQYIGLRIIGSEANILLAGREEIPFSSPDFETIIQYRREVVRLINRERGRMNLAPLTMQDNLQLSAQKYAEQMWNEKFYGHTDPKGVTVEDRIEAAGYTDPKRIQCNCTAVSYAIGENIAKGQSTPAQVMRDWMKSDGHRKNILSTDFTEVGIGVYGNRWVQHFGAVITY
jgi:uncharacterized protein YkwD